ncbi:hypothetical protein HK102_012245 [Quaeritorhiza haematococci]|nr:hypothetical protein HK102_012245 [Quaeritorhiza haematococci]
MGVVGVNSVSRPRKTNLTSPKSPHKEEPTYRSTPSEDSTADYRDGFSSMIGEFESEESTGTDADDELDAESGGEETEEEEETIEVDHHEDIRDDRHAEAEYLRAMGSEETLTEDWTGVMEFLRAQSSAESNAPTEEIVEDELDVSRSNGSIDWADELESHSESGYTHSDELPLQASGDPCASAIQNPDEEAVSPGSDRSHRTESNADDSEGSLRIQPRSTLPKRTMVIYSSDSEISDPGINGDLTGFLANLTIHTKPKPNISNTTRGQKFDADAEEMAEATHLSDTVASHVALTNDVESDSCDDIVMSRGPAQVASRRRLLVFSSESSGEEDTQSVGDRTTAPPNVPDEIRHIDEVIPADSAEFSHSMILSDSNDTNETQSPPNLMSHVEVQDSASSADEEAGSAFVNRLQILQRSSPSDRLPLSWSSDEDDKSTVMEPQRSQVINVDDTEPLLDEPIRTPASDITSPWTSMESSFSGDLQLNESGQGSPPIYVHFSSSDSSDTSIRRPGRNTIRSGRSGTRRTHALSSDSELDGSKAYDLQDCTSRTNEGNGNFITAQLLKRESLSSVSQEIIDINNAGRSHEDSAPSTAAEDVGLSTIFGDFLNDQQTCGPRQAPAKVYGSSSDSSDSLIQGPRRSARPGLRRTIVLSSDSDSEGTEADLRGKIDDERVGLVAERVQAGQKDVDEDLLKHVDILGTPSTVCIVDTDSGADTPAVIQTKPEIWELRDPDNLIPTTPGRK